MFRGRLPGYSHLLAWDGSSGLSQTTRAQPLPNDELPSFARILNKLYRNTPGRGDCKNFITYVAILHDAAFSPKCPILGVGHHFTVYASPFDTSDHDFSVVNGRAFNDQVYCLKIVNFNSPSNTGQSDEFRKDYYHVVLQELRVLLHADIRKAKNRINIFGLNFHEDYDDYTVSLPVLIMEFAEHGTFDTLQEDVQVDSELAKMLLLDVARGINSLH